MTVSLFLLKLSVSRRALRSAEKGRLKIRREVSSTAHHLSSVKSTVSSLLPFTLNLKSPSISPSPLRSEIWLPSALSSLRCLKHES